MLSGKGKLAKGKKTFHSVSYWWYFSVLCSSKLYLLRHWFSYLRSGSPLRGICLRKFFGMFNSIELRKCQQSTQAKMWNFSTTQQSTVQQKRYKSLPGHFLLMLVLIWLLQVFPLWACVTTFALDGKPYTIIMITSIVIIARLKID